MCRTLARRWSGWTGCRSMLEMVGTVAARHLPVPVPTRAVGRAKATSGDCAGADYRADFRGGRRADLDAGRLDPHRRDAPDGGPGRAAGDQLPVHHARPGRGALHVLKDRGDVPGQDRGNGRHGGGAAEPPAPLHASAAVGRADPGSDGDAGAGADLRWGGHAAGSAGSRCRFYSRCPIADDFCRDNPHPGLEEKGQGQRVACYKV